MRQAIKTRLIAQIPEIESRCYEPHEVTSGTTKPYLVIKQGIEKEANPWSGFQKTFEIWPYVDLTGTFVTVDTLAAKVNAALEKQLLVTGDDQEFSCFSLGTAGSDLVDNALNAITRGVLFAVAAVQPVEVSETATDDPWLDVLAVWTGTFLGGAFPGVTWTIHRNIWPLDYERPAVLWRIANIESKNQGPRTYTMRKILIGHVLGSTPNQQIAAALKILQELNIKNQLALNAGTKQYLTVDDVSINYAADPLNKGQITLILSKVMVSPFEPVTPMGGVNYKDIEIE